MGIGFADVVTVDAISAADAFVANGVIGSDAAKQSGVMDSVAASSMLLTTLAIVPTETDGIAIENITGDDGAVGAGEGDSIDAFSARNCGACA
jgi:hypothetical protein